MIASKYKLPIIIISNSIINISVTENPFIILNKNIQNNNYYFVKIPSQYHRGQKNYKLLYFTNSTTINVETEIIDTDKLSLKTNILSELENFKDYILDSIIDNDTKKIQPKNKKLEKKINEKK